MNEKEQKSYIGLLLELRRRIDGTIENEITEGVFRGRPNAKDMTESIQYQLETFNDMCVRLN